MTPRIPGDVIVLPESQGRWVLFNTRAQTCLALDSDGLRFLSAVTRSDEPPAPRGHVRIWRIARFAQADGLLADPTPYIRDVEEWPEAEDLTPAEAIGVLSELGFLVEDLVGYRSRFALKTSILDNDHMGNLHQRLGQDLLLRRRVMPEAFWLEQKFEPDLRRVRDNLYGAVQKHFLDEYFAQRIPAGASVLDIGCGIGFYSKQIAALGASVLGVDPNPNYIEQAIKDAPSGVRYEVRDVGSPGALDDIPPESMDFVFISDVLLFYFIPVDPKQHADIDVLLADIRRALKPEGTVISLEPHSVFWQTPWLGDADAPFTVINEYLDPIYRVTPSVSDLVKAFARSGFAVSWMSELTPDPRHESRDARAFHFAKQFPVWHLFELIKVEHGSPTHR